MSLFPADLPPVFLDISLAMEQIGDAQAMQGMLSMLEENLARDVPRIAELLVQNDVKGANRLLHAMKGFIPIFCVESLCNHVAAVELMSKAGTANEVRVAYEALMPDLDQLQSEVAVYLNEQGAAY